MRLLPYLCISDTARPKCSFAEFYTEFYAESRAFPAVEREERLMKRPVIGVMPLYDDEKDSFWMLPGYFEGLEEAGAIPLMLSPNLDEEGFSLIRGMIDGYLFTGGHDVNPALYGEKPVPEDEAFCDRRDRLEMMVFKWCDRQDIPALGICRGIQLFNVARGGTLWQDLTDYRPDVLQHVQRYKRSYLHHSVQLEKDSYVQKLFGTESVMTNSMHHQAVKELGRGLKASGHAKDGVIEAMEDEEGLIIAVQWHPEGLTESNPIMNRLFQDLVKRCGKKS